MISISALLAANDALRAEIRALSTSHFGVLTPAATRAAIARIVGPHDLIVIDIRKMNALNFVLGYSRANEIIADLVTFRQAPGRAPDVAGQWGGDEFVFVVPAGDGRGMLARLLACAARLSSTLTRVERAELLARTGYRVGGIAIAAVLVEGSTDLRADVAIAVDGTETLKDVGPVSANRNMCGAAGTICARLERVRP